MIIVYVSNERKVDMMYSYSIVIVYSSNNSDVAYKNHYTSLTSSTLEA